MKAANVAPEKLLDLSWLARLVGYAGLVGLGVGLWGMVGAEAWDKDQASTGDRVRPAAAAVRQ